MILFRECLSNGIIPTFVEKEADLEYKLAIGKAQTIGDYEDLIRIFKDAQASFYKSMREYLYVHEINKNPESKLIETREGLLTVAEIKKKALNGNPPELIHERDQAVLRGRELEKE